MATLVSLLVTLLIGGLILWLLLFVIGLIPLPEPFKQIATVIVYVIAVIWLISLLLPFAGHSFPVFR